MRIWFIYEIWSMNKLYSSIKIKPEVHLNPKGRRTYHFTIVVAGGGVLELSYYKWNSSEYWEQIPNEAFLRDKKPIENRMEEAVALFFIRFLTVKSRLQNKTGKFSLQLSMNISIKLIIITTYGIDLFGMEDVDVDDTMK